MDYIGSKKKFLDYIFATLSEYLSEDEFKDCLFVDGCAGSGVVSIEAAKLGMTVVSNDLMKFSGTIVRGTTFITESDIDLIKGYIDIINKLEPTEGFFYKNYSEHSGKLYFSDKNAKKIDAIRNYIDMIPHSSIRDYLLMCSLEAISRVSNTTGVQAAFLKKLKSRAIDDIELRMEKFVTSDAVVTCSKPIEYLVQTISCDVLYVDPPYNERQYAPNYHLYETFVVNDNPEIKGKTGLRDYSKQKSSFCSKKEIAQSICKILDANAGIIMFSYSTDGLLTEEEFLNIIKNYLPNAVVDVKRKEQRRYRSNNENVVNESDLSELLFVIRK